MNFSPDNRATLETLLAGLSAGVSGEQAAPILAATLQAQQAQAEARKQRYQEMASNVANLAGQGMTYGSVGNYIDTMTPQSGIPGKFQQLLDAAYANPDIPAQLQNQVSPAGTGFVQQPSGGFSMESRPEIIPNDVQQQVQSPLFTQNPASTGAYNMNPGSSQGNLMTAPGQARYAAMGQMIANQPAPPQPTDADMMGAVNAQINKMRAAQMSPDEIVQAISTNPQVQGVIMDNFNEFMALQPEVMQVMAPGMGA